MNRCSASKGPAPVLRPGGRKARPHLVLLWRHLISPERPWTASSTTWFLDDRACLCAQERYKRRMDENLRAAGADGNPFRILPARSPRGGDACRRNLRLVDDMLQEAKGLDTIPARRRHLPKIRTFESHTARVGSLSWNCNILTSGNRDKYIINYDANKFSQTVYLYDQAIDLNSSNVAYWENHAFSHTKLEE